MNRKVRRFLSFARLKNMNNYFLSAKSMNNYRFRRTTRESLEFS